MVGLNDEFVNKKVFFSEKESKVGKILDFSSCLKGNLSKI
jgi:hypothetical protein